MAKPQTQRMTVARDIYRFVASLVFASIFVAVFLAGAGVFGATDYDAHKLAGTVVQVGALLLLVLALVGRYRVVPTAVLFVLALIQGFLVHFSSDWLKALHPVNALLIYGLVAWLAHSAWSGRRADRTTAA